MVIQAKTAAQGRREPMGVETLSILLIEDNNGDARLIREMLLTYAEWEIQWSHVVTLREGLDALDTEFYDTILLDLGLPDSDGLETLRQVNERAPNTAILVLTGHSDQKLGVRAVADGAQDYLVKGEIEGRLLVRAIRYAIERTRAEYAMRQQTQTIAAIEERQRIARELHDNVSQTLFVCRSMGEAALRHLESNPAYARELLEETNRLTAAALAEMRILLLELRPTAMARANIQQLFEQYVKAFAVRRGTEVHLEIGDLAPLPEGVQIAFYRIMQEALNNIIKHAQAKQVDVTVKDGGGYVALSVNDDGRGFDLAATQATSMGLSIIRERAEAIDAELDIVSHPGEGTQIRVRWMKTEL